MLGHLKKQVIWPSCTRFLPGGFHPKGFHRPWQILDRMKPHDGEDGEDMKSKSVARPMMNSRGHYTGWMKHAGVNRSMKKTPAEKIRDEIVKRQTSGRGSVVSIGFDEDGEC